MKRTVWVVAALSLIWLGEDVRAQSSLTDLLGPEVALNEEGFAIRPPAGWEQKPSSTPQMKALFTGPMKGGVPPFVAVWVDVVPGNVMDFVTWLRNFYGQTRMDNEIVRVNIVFVHNQPERAFVEWAYTLQDTRLKVLELIVASGDRKYTAECSAPAAGFDEYQRVFESALATFRLVGAVGEKQIAAFQMRADGSYLNTRDHFSIMPPKGWKADHSGQQGVVSFLGPIGPEGGIPVIRVECVQNPKSLAEHEEALRQVLTERLPDFKLLSDIRTAIGDQQAFKISFTFKHRVGEENYLMRNLKVVLGPGDLKYVVTCGTLASAFPEVEKTFEAAVQSFRIEKARGQTK